MSDYKFRTVHQTVEHATKIPMPKNVSKPWEANGTAVFFTDLPASVWAAVVVEIDEPRNHRLYTFDSASARLEWLDNATREAQKTIDEETIRLVARIIAWSCGEDDPQAASANTHYQDTAQMCCEDLALYAPNNGSPLQLSP